MGANEAKHSANKVQMDEETFVCTCPDMILTYHFPNGILINCFEYV